MSTGSRRHVLPAVIGTILFTSAFPILAHLVPSAGLAGVLLVIPVAFAARRRGERAGLFSALGAAVYTNAVVLTEYWLLQHRSGFPPRFLLLFLFDLTLLFLAATVGRLGRALQEKNAADSALRSALARLQAVLDAIPDHLVEVDGQGTILAFRFSGAGSWQDNAAASPIGRLVSEALPAEVSAVVMNAVREAGGKGQSRNHSFSVTRDGRTRWYELSAASIGDPVDPAGRFITLARDMTERKALEQQLVQSQKMEAIGRLAGGIAHDFNNILQVIIGFCELIQATGKEGADTEKYVSTIRDSAERAASLTQHLLAFSRKQMLAPKVIDLDALVEESLHMLGRLLGENISATHTTDGEANRVRADPGQLGQMITNLAVNARDAMPFGGRLVIHVQRVEVGAADAALPSEIVPGDYVLIQVSDTGTGIDAETLSHLFEPFFTTKVLGRGTGLGLSIVYGVVKQSGGYIYVQSRQGSGTTFSVYLPRVPEEGERAGSCPEEEHQGTGTILLVEDEEDVRRLIHRHLSDCGYNVLQAGDGRTAMGIFRQEAGGIHLLLVDVGLPDIRGDTVARDFRSAHPAGKIVFMTGYTDSTGFVETAQKENATILHKPFALSRLAGRIRHALDEPAGRTG